MPEFSSFWHWAGWFLIICVVCLSAVAATLGLKEKG